MTRGPVIVAIVGACLAAGCGFQIHGVTGGGDDAAGGDVGRDAHRDGSTDGVGDGAIDGAIDAAIDAPIDAADPLDAVRPMAGQRWLLPCTSGDLGSHNCNCASGVLTQTATIGGSLGAHYTVTVHIRGAMEALNFTGGTAGNGGWYVGGNKGGDNGDNLYSLVTSSPSATYWINKGSVVSRSYKYDYMATFNVDAGATVTFNESGQDGLQWGNWDGAAVITFPGVTTTPNPYLGQFAQLDVVSATQF